MNKEEIEQIIEDDIEILMDFVARASSFCIMTSPIYSSKIEYCVTIADNINVFEADRFIRISMVNPVYLDNEFRFSSQEKEEFIKLVTENWDSIILKSNIELRDEKLKPIPENLPIPDYTKLPERK